MTINTARRYRRLTAVLALLLTLVPLSTLASSHHTATRTTVAFTSTLVEVVDPGTEWIDAEGGFHFRNTVQIEEVTGDISGTLTIEFNGDFVPAGECIDEACPSFFTLWGSLEIEGDDGGWYGTYVSIGSDVPGEEFSEDTLVLRGRGDNANKSIFATAVGEDEGSLTFEGTMSMLATPLINLNTNIFLCEEPETFATDGGYLSTGAIDGQGAATGNFIVAAGELSSRYAAGGTLTLTDEQGSVTVAFAGAVQDVITQHQYSHFWGQYLILEGTGVYAELYGHGRILGTAGYKPTCSSGFGIDIQLLGEAHYN